MVVQGPVLIVHRRAPVGRASAAPPAVGGGVLVIGKCGQVGEVLKPPRLAPGRAGEDHGGEVHVKPGDGFLVGVLGSQGKPLKKQLHGAAAVALQRADVSAAAALETAVEFAGDDVPVALDASKADGGTLKQAPVLGPGGDDGFAEVVDFAGSAEVQKAGDGQVEVATDLLGIVGLVQRELAQAVVGVLKIAVGVGLGEPVALLLMGFLLRRHDEVKPGQGTDQAGTGETGASCSEHASDSLQRSGSGRSGRMEVLWVLR